MSNADRESLIGRDMERMFQDVVVSKGRVRQDVMALTGGNTSRYRRRAPWLLISTPIIVGLLVIGSAVRIGTQAVPRVDTASRRLVLPKHPHSETFTAAKVAVPTSNSVAATAQPRRLASVEPAPVIQGRETRRPEPLGADRNVLHSITLPRATDKTVLHEPCSLHANVNDCIYGDVLEADRRLRVAYDVAVKDGASADQLAWINRQWRQARSISLDDPDETIRRYDALARELDASRSEDALQ